MNETIDRYWKNTHNKKIKYLIHDNTGRVWKLFHLWPFDADSNVEHFHHCKYVFSILYSIFCVSSNQYCSIALNWYYFENELECLENVERVQCMRNLRFMHTRMKKKKKKKHENITLNIYWTYSLALSFSISHAVCRCVNVCGKGVVNAYPLCSYALLSRWYSNTNIHLCTCTTNNFMRDKTKANQ